MPQDKTIYELSMIRDRLDELDQILSQDKSNIGVDGNPIDGRAALDLAACIEKAMAVADAIAAKHKEQAPAAAPLPQPVPARG